MRGLLFLAFTMSALASCGLNRFACEPPSFDCVVVCTLYNSQKACEAIPGCDWEVREDKNGIPSAACRNNTLPPDCRNFNESECGVNPMCSWKETPCNKDFICIPNRTGVSCPTYDSWNCTNHSGCELGLICAASHPCAMIMDQRICVAREGCLWSEYAQESLSGRFLTKRCGPCFTDFTNAENYASARLARLGRTCSLPDNNSITLTMRKAIAAATGCSGGQPAFDVDMFSECNPPLGVGTSTSFPTNNNLAAVMIVSIGVLLLTR